MPTVYLMGLALAHARRLEKFGAWAHPIETEKFMEKD
jgi:hypothetical protein